MSKTRAWSAFGQIYASRWLISILQISRLLQVWYMDICLQSGGKKKRYAYHASQVVKVVDNHIKVLVLVQVIHLKKKMF